MVLLARFDPPADSNELDDPGRQSWSDDFLAFHTELFAARFPQYYDPRAVETPNNLAPTPVVWSAFPARLINLPNEIRWATADANRDEQDEYCEWLTTRDSSGVVTKVTFTTEVPDYWSHIAEQSEDLLLSLYQDLVSDDVQLTDLQDADGNYRRTNQWNDAADSSGITHLQQQTNTLLAALDIVANSTILRQVNGKLVTDRQQLVSCGGLGNPRRNSDPQIAEVVNDAAALGAEVTLANPVGLYLDGLQVGGIVAPDGADAATFWNIERGTHEKAVRATFQVPEERGYAVGDLTIHGAPVEWGAQVADKVRVRVEVFAKPGGHHPQAQPCVG